ncbi:MAG: hypothetical protein IJ437_03050 [Clostridia bacterium]|nr:hypothetical protein [Clostridia bacterium]
MRLEIKYKEKTDEALEYLISRIPRELGTSIMCFLNENKYSFINEIRMKKNSFIYLIADSKNVKTDIFVSEACIESTFEALCGGSIYAHYDTIKEGYISVGQGIRAGVCGTAVMDGTLISGIKDISSINIRIPQRIYGASNYIFTLLEKNNFKSSLLLYSPPGVGKTSILRDLVIRLNELATPIRFSVIDSREEIITPHSFCSNCDAFLSYPKGTAIELATKSMTPELIICDEISTEAEAQAVFKASHNGVKLIATTHSSSYNELISKSILEPLLSSNVFDFAIGVSRKYGEKSYKFTLNKLFNEA